MRKAGRMAYKRDFIYYLFIAGGKAVLQDVCVGEHAQPEQGQAATAAAAGGGAARVAHRGLLQGGARSGGGGGRAALHTRRPRQGRGCGVPHGLVST
eukprot:683293-Pyramimonas_sp.AAC.2